MIAREKLGGFITTFGSFINIPYRIYGMNSGIVFLVIVVHNKGSKFLSAVLFKFRSSKIVIEFIKRDPIMLDFKRKNAGSQVDTNGHSQFIL